MANERVLDRLLDEAGLLLHKTGGNLTWFRTGARVVLVMRDRSHRPYTAVPVAFSMQLRDLNESIVHCLEATGHDLATAHIVAFLARPGDTYPEESGDFEVAI